MTPTFMLAQAMGLVSYGEVHGNPGTQEATVSCYHLSGRKQPTPYKEKSAPVISFSDLWLISPKSCQLQMVHNGWKTCMTIHLSLTAHRHFLYPKFRSKLFRKCQKSAHIYVEPVKTIDLLSKKSRKPLSRSVWWNGAKKMHELC